MKLKLFRSFYNFWISVEKLEDELDKNNKNKILLKI